MPIIFALDVATETGFAFGEAGQCPTSGSVRLKAPSEPRAQAFGNMLDWLDKKFRPKATRPTLVVKESPLHLSAFKKLENAAATVVFTERLHGNVEGMCVRYGIPFKDVADSTYRKHFIGFGRMGNRTDTKTAMLQRAIALKYMPKNCTDDNRADAIGLFDYAAHTFFRRSGGQLVLFGEAA